MKRVFILSTMPMLLSAFFSACLATYGDTISRSYTRLNPDTSVVQFARKPVLVYFEGEPVHFAYVKIGIIEVTGDQFATTRDLLNNLKFGALKNGANAVISTKDGYKTRQSGVLISKTPPTEYSAHIYTGLAVKFTDNDQFDVMSNKSDTAFIQPVREKDIANARRSGNQLVASFVLTIALGILLVYAIATK